MANLILLQHPSQRLHRRQRRRLRSGRLPNFDGMLVDMELPEMISVPEQAVASQPRPAPIPLSSFNSDMSTQVRVQASVDPSSVNTTQIGTRGVKLQPQLHTCLLHPKLRQLISRRDHAQVDQLCRSLVLSRRTRLVQCSCLMIQCRKERRTGCPQKRSISYGNASEGTTWLLSIQFWSLCCHLLPK